MSDVFIDVCLFVTMSSFHQIRTFFLKYGTLGQNSENSSNIETRMHMTELETIKIHTAEYGAINIYHFQEKMNVYFCMWRNLWIWHLHQTKPYDKHSNRFCGWQHNKFSMNVIQHYFGKQCMLIPITPFPFITFIPCGNSLQSRKFYVHHMNHQHAFVKAFKVVHQQDFHK